MYFDFFILPLLPIIRVRESTGFSSLDWFSFSGGGQLAGGLNTFGCVQQNPIRFKDEQGLFINPVGAVVGGVVDIGGQLYRNGGLTRESIMAIDLGEVGVAAVVGGTLPGVGRLFTNHLKYGGLSREVVSGVVAGSAINKYYDLVPPEKEGGPTPRLSITVGDIFSLFDDPPQDESCID